MENDEREGEQSQGCPAAFRCKYCESDTREDLVKAALWGDQGLVAIEDIPARVCDGCGEQFYDEETARLIEQIATGPHVAAGREILVPVFSLAEVGVSAKKDQSSGGPGA